MPVAVRSALGALALLLLASPATGAPLVLEAVDSGFVNAAGRTSKNDGVVLGAVDATFNYSVGAIDEVAPLGGTDVPRKNFFTFDLGAVTAPIASATLVLFNPVGGYSSPDPSELYVLGGAEVPDAAAMAALASDLATVLSIFDAGELATAASLFPEVAKTLEVPLPDFGAALVSAADDGTDVMIPMTPFGVDYLNAFLGGEVVLGGVLASLDAVDAGDEVVFGFTKPLIPGTLSPDPPIVAPTPTPKLVLTLVPEPGTAVLVAAGLAALATARRRALR